LSVADATTVCGRIDSVAQRRRDVGPGPWRKTARLHVAVVVRSRMRLITSRRNRAGTAPRRRAILGDSPQYSVAVSAQSRTVLRPSARDTARRDTPRAPNHFSPRSRRYCAPPPSDTWGQSPVRRRSFCAESGDVATALREARYADPLLFRSPPRHFEPVQLLFDLVKRVVADLIAVAHGEHGLPRGLQGGTMNLDVRRANVVPRSFSV
jgi:hypothetical protein